MTCQSPSASMRRRDVQRLGHALAARVEVENHALAPRRVRHLRRARAETVRARTAELVVVSIHRVVHVVDADGVLDVPERPGRGEQPHGAIRAGARVPGSAVRWSAACPDRANHAGGASRSTTASAGVGERTPHGVVARVVHAADHELDALVALAQPREGMRQGNPRPERAACEVEPHAPQQAQELRHVLDPGRRIFHQGAHHAPRVEPRSRSRSRIQLGAGTLWPTGRTTETLRARGFPAFVVFGFGDRGRRNVREASRPLRTQPGARPWCWRISRRAREAGRPPAIAADGDGDGRCSARRADHVDGDQAPGAPGRSFVDRARVRVGGGRRGLLAGARRAARRRAGWGGRGGGAGEETGNAREDLRRWIRELVARRVGRADWKDGTSSVSGGDTIHEIGDARRRRRVLAPRRRLVATHGIQNDDAPS